MKLKNWKTTIFGILAIIGQVLPLFGVDISLQVADIASTVAVAGGLLSAKDKDVTGAGNNARRVD